MHKFDFKNRTAIITGGAQGFGLDVAKRFLDSGAQVFIWDIDEKLLKSVVDEIKNPNLKFSVVDVSNYEDVEKKALKIQNKKITIIINYELSKKNNSYYYLSYYFIWGMLRC